MDSEPFVVILVLKLMATGTNLRGNCVVVLWFNWLLWKEEVMSAELIKWGMLESSLLELGEGSLRGDPERGVEGAVRGRVGVGAIIGGYCVGKEVCDELLSFLLSSGSISRMPAFLKEDPENPE